MVIFKTTLTYEHYVLQHTKYLCYTIYQWNKNHIGCVMVSVLASGVADCEFEPHSSQTKDYQIGICCFSAKLVSP